MIFDILLTLLLLAAVVALLAARRQLAAARADAANAARDYELRIEHLHKARPALPAMPDALVTYVPWLHSDELTRANRAFQAAEAADDDSEGSALDAYNAIRANYLDTAERAIEATYNALHARGITARPTE